VHDSAGGNADGNRAIKSRREVTLTRSADGEFSPQDENRGGALSSIRGIGLSFRQTNRTSPRQTGNPSTSA